MRSTRTRIIAGAAGLLAVALAAAGALLGPLALGGPRVLRTTPAEGAAGVNPRGEIVVELSQELQQGGVAVSSEPPADLTATVEGARLRIAPGPAGLAYGQAYRLTIAGLRNRLGRGADAPATLAFTTAPYASVRQLAPADGAADVPLRGPITVEFASPVVTAEQVRAAADDPRAADRLPQPLTVAPEGAPGQAAKGVGRWLSPTLFGFYPSEDLRSASAYRATLSAAVSGDGQAQLKDPVSWGFRTAAPLLVGSRPFAGEGDVPLVGPIEVLLAPDVDVASAGAAFQLLPAGGGGPVAGAVAPADGGFRFTPAAPLASGQKYEAVLGAGVKSRSGATLNPQALRWQFGTIGDPEVVQVEPPADAADVPAGARRISVRFSHPIVALTERTDQATLPSPLTIDPPLAGAGRWLDTSTYVYSPTAGLEPSTTYRATVAAGLRDQTGGELRDAYAWSFATIQPDVADSWPEGEDVPPTSTVRIEFNQPMDPAGAQNVLLLREGDASQVPGTRTVRGSVVEITPSAPLERGAQYRMVAPVDLASANGRGKLASPFTKVFRVAPLPALASSSPAQGDRSGDPNGSLQLTFTTEMDWGSVARSVSIDPPPTEVYTSSYDLTYSIFGALRPETDYTVTISGTAQDRSGVPIGRDTAVKFRTAPLDPSLAVVGTAGRVGAYSSYAEARVPVQVVNIESVRYTLARLGAADGVRLSASYDAWNGYEPEKGAVVASGTLDTPGERNRARIALLGLGKLAPGLYVIDVQGGGQRERQIMAVSPYALTIKHSADRLFVWAVDMASGKPAAGVDLSVATYDYQEDKVSAPQALGATGADGTLDVPFDSVDAYTTLYLWGGGAQPSAFFTTDWSSGISPWDFGLAADYGSAGLVGSIATDRPIYRPDQTVHVRGALRLREFDGDNPLERYRTPAGAQATLLVSDPEGNSVLTRTLTLGEFGTFSTDVPIASGAPLGAYTVVATLDKLDGSSVSGSFAVAEYRKPTFEIEVAPSSPDVVQGDALSASVTARYFAGGALAGAPVRWRLLAAPAFFSPEQLPDFSFGDFDDAYLWYRGGGTYGGASLVADGEAKTDAQGRFTLSLPADTYGRATDAQGGKVAPGARQLTVEFDVTDVDGQVITGQGTVQVHPAAFYIGVRPEGYVVRAGDPQKVTLATVTTAGDPAPARALKVEVFQREWYSVRERGDDGQRYWTSRYSDTLVQTLPATTDAKGRAEVSFSPPKGGSYHIRASGADDSGRQAVSSAFSWAYGGDVFWGLDDTNRVDVVADRRSYRPGDTAGLLVTAPYPGMSGLLTIERGRVIEHRLITIQGTTELIQVPIKGEYAPNVFVSLTLIKTPCADASSSACPSVPDLRVGLVSLPVSTEQQQLTVTVTPDKAQAGPRDSVTYTVKATDSAGAGVRAEVGLALVDKAVLSLADDPNPSLVDAFYTRRALGVQTSQTLTALVDRVTVKLQPGDKGGGGAEEAGPPLRREFPDTAYWNPSVVTGADGTATVTVALPDSLTTWRMGARAITADTRVGQAAADVVVTRPLFVRPALPRFLTAGDAPALQAVVQNSTASAVDASVTLEVAGDQAGALKLDSPAQQRVQVPAGGTAVVRWQAKLDPSVMAGGALTLRLTAEGGGLKDSVEATLPVQRFQTPEAVASAGQVIDTTVETVRKPQGDGELRLELTPSLAAGIYTGLDYLEAFPYECSEQTVSKFLPNAVTYRLFKDAGRDDPALRKALETNLARGAQRLAALQHLDGGWGWWEDDDSNPYITAYVAQGLLAARQAGMQVDDRMLSDGLDYLGRALDGDQLALGKGDGADDVRAFALFILSEAGRPDRARAVALFEKRGDLQVYGRAYLLMTLKAAGGEDARVRTLVAELMGSAVLTTAEAHWEERRPDYWTMSSDARSTALAMQALVRADPQNFLIPNAARYLMSLRDGGHWRTTQETATSAVALAEYVASSGELKADYRYSAALAGKTLREGQVGKDNLSDAVSVAVSLADLSAPESQLVLQKQGDGRLYYTLRMRSYVDAAAVQPLDRGVQVDRAYVAVAQDTLTPTGQLVTQAKLGEVVQVRITLRVPTDMTYFAVEDMLPAGLEPLDASLKTVSSAAQGPDLAEEGGDGYGYWGYWTRSAVRDDRVALFATDLASGTYTYTYLARATTPGVFKAPPATAYQMYAPEVYGRSAGSSFTVTEP